jgi:hypothetical protein
MGGIRNATVELFFDPRDQQVKEWLPTGGRVEMSGF